MSEPRPLSEAEEADLAALADGRLAADERAVLEARLAEDADLARALDRQRAGLTAITAAAESVSAPLALRARVAAMQREPEPKRRRWRLPGPRGLIPAAALAAAAAVAVFVVIAGGPETEAILSAAVKAPVAAVSLDPTDPGKLQDRVQQTRFPNWETDLDWVATGTRTDRIQGRHTQTVFYRSEGRETAYTIVAGDALAWPDGKVTTITGKEFRTFNDGDRNVVTWRRDGHTCVLSGVDVTPEQLLKLASW